MKFTIRYNYCVVSQSLLGSTFLTGVRTIKNFDILVEEIDGLKEQR